MKRAIIFPVGLLAVSLIFAACGGQASSASASQSLPASSATVSSGPVQLPVSEVPEQDMASAYVYRGVLQELTDRSFAVSQVPGYDYGEERVDFHLSIESTIGPAGASLSDGAYVEVFYNGVLTGGAPPQATVERVYVLAETAEGVVQNGTIAEVTETDEGYVLKLAVPDAAADGGVHYSTLHVAPEALEHLDEADLVEGTMVSAVTRATPNNEGGVYYVATALLPYSDAA